MFFLLQVSFRNFLKGTFALELRKFIKSHILKKKKKRLDNISVTFQSFTSQINVYTFLVFQRSNYVKLFNVI